MPKGAPRGGKAPVSNIVGLVHNFILTSLPTYHVAFFKSGLCRTKKNETGAVGQKIKKCKDSDMVVKKSYIIFPIAGYNSDLPLILLC